MNVSCSETGAEKTLLAGVEAEYVAAFRVITVPSSYRDILGVEYELYKNSLTIHHNDTDVSLKSFKFSTVVAVSSQPFRHLHFNIDRPISGDVNLLGIRFSTWIRVRRGWGRPKMLRML